MTRCVVYFRQEFARSGGAERLALEWLSRLEARGVHARVLTYRHDPEGVFDGRYRTPVETQPAEASFLGRVLWLRKRLAALEPDAVIVEGDGDHVMDVSLALFGTGRRYLALIHGSFLAFPPERELTKYSLVFRAAFAAIRAASPGYRTFVPPEPPPMGPVRRLMLEAYSLVKWLAVRGAHRRLVLSRRNAAEVALLYGRDARVVRGAIPEGLLDRAPGADHRRALGLEGQTIVLSVCRLAGPKRVDLALRAFARVAAERPGAVLLVGGEGPERGRLESLAGELGLGARVRFLGHVPDAGLWDLMACCDAFVSMDLADFDLAPVEALALGRKVVWSDEMEAGEELDGDPGVFAAAPDAESVARALSTALDAPAPGMGAERRRRLARLSWESYCERADAELEAVCGG